MEYEKGGVTIRTIEELKFLQSQTLDRKILMTQARIIEWYNRWEGKVSVSFSGGKDSTVLLDIARKCYPDVEAVFFDTGLEFPEIRDFVKTKENVTWLKPEMNFREVVEKYGWCYPSKKISRAVRYARQGSTWANERFLGNYKGKKHEWTESRFCKWKFLVDSNFKISDKCCGVMKEKPAREYEKKSGKKAIIGTMADESNNRKTGWLKTGCNAFDSKRPISKPLSFWTEQDVLEYIKRYNLPYASVYGEIYRDKEGLLHTSGEQRTGCMFCPVGCHLDKVNRFQRMKKTHPKQWAYVINQLGLGEFLDFVGVDYGKNENDQDLQLELGKETD